MSPVYTRHWYNDKDLLLKSALFLGLTILTIWRKPELLVHPRFWAEEGKYYFSYAYNHSLLQNLTYPQFGYYTLYNSIVTSFATIFPLELAPLVTTWGAFTVQLIVGFFVLWGDIPLLDTYAKRAAVLFLIPLLCFYTGSWLNTIGVQYWLCILTFLILNEAPFSGGKLLTTSRIALLTLAGLTGVTSCFMTPVFYLKWIRTKSRQFAIYTMILGVCSCIQISAFLNAFLNRDPGIEMRFVYNNPIHLISKVLCFQFAEPFLGHWLFLLAPVANLDEVINAKIATLFGPTVFISETLVIWEILGACIFVFVMYLFCRKIRDPNYQYIIAAFVLVFVLSSFLSLNMSAGPRYTFAPNVMLAFFMCSVWDDLRLKISRHTIKIVLTFSLLMHAVAFRGNMGFAYNDFWPKWTFEVQQWRNDPSYRLKIWPAGWDISLKWDE